MNQNTYFDQAFSAILIAIKAIIIEIRTAIKIEQQKAPIDPSIRTVQQYHTEIRSKIEELSTRAAIMNFKTDQYCLIKTYGTMLSMVDRALKEENYKSKFVQLNLLHKMFDDFEKQSTFLYWKSRVILGNRAVKETDG
jgi:hypothetical protein